MTEIEKNNKYSEGKIYFLMNDLNHEIFYVGNTIQKLKRRLGRHKNAAFDFNRECFNCKKCNYIRLMNINDDHGYDNISIHLIENYSCESKNDLFFRERHWINLLNPCCNMIIPIRTKEEWNEYHRNYINQNKHIISQKNKDYCEKNKFIISERKKKYYERNKEKINKKRSEKIKCECGDYISRNGIKYHITTQLHKDIMRMNELD